jgi:ketosteroid isomerase-like protein
MEKAREEIEEIIAREIRAWETKDIGLLMTVYHPDMVWPWAPNTSAHDPMEWVMGVGRFDHDRWSAIFQRILDTQQVLSSKREIRKIAISTEGDGAFAVMDVEIHICGMDGVEKTIKGRSCKIYTRTGSEWKLIMQVGPLEY